MDNTIALYAYPNNTNNSSYENEPLDKNNKILTPITTRYLHPFFCPSLQPKE